MGNNKKERPFSGTRPIPAPPPPPPTYAKVTAGGSLQFTYELEWTRRRGVDRYIQVQCFLLLPPRIRNEKSVPRVRIEDVVEQPTIRKAVPAGSKAMLMEVKTRAGLKGVHRVLVVATVGSITGYRLMKVIGK
ncbi:MAG: hypothetical protein KJZ62_12960 [Fimbriimonadaceae bacterium]|nr:hypothetical protein [Fimbriimonadaceae bacterium]QOJ12466.1 MAG: hypothetical protein HRU74_10545 [Chthonomonadaceae bacterium]